MATITITITPIELAEVLGVTPFMVREILRANYEDEAPGKGGRWLITPEMAEKVHGIVFEWKLEEIDGLFQP